MMAMESVHPFFLKDALCDAHGVTIQKASKRLTSFCGTRRNVPAAVGARKFVPKTRYIWKKRFRCWIEKNVPGVESA